MNTLRTRLCKPGFAFLFVIALAHGVFGSESKPVRVIDLTVPKSYGTGEGGQYGLTYLRAGQVAVWFTDRTQGVGGLTRRDQLQANDPWRMRVQIVDTATASIKTLDWPSRKISSSLVATGDGGFVALTGPLVRCFSSDQKETGQLRLRDYAPNRNYRTLTPSPAGKAVWVVDSADKFIIGRIDSSACKLSWSVAQSTEFSYVSGNDEMTIATLGPTIGYYVAGKKWNRLYRADDCCVANAKFVNQKIIFAYHDNRQEQRSLMAFDTEGKQLFNEELPKGHDLGPIAASSDGKVAAVVIPKSEWITTFYDPSPKKAKIQILVYDTNSLRRITEFEMQAADAAHFAIAIDRGGRELAVLAGSKLSIFEISQ